MSESVKLAIKGGEVLFETAEELDLFINEMITRRIEAFGNDLEVTATNSMEQEELLSFIVHLINEYNDKSTSFDIKLFYGEPVSLH